MARIFISYRRADSRLVANRIYDRLVQAFGEKSVFKDVDNIPPGRDFRGVLREATANCEVMLVIIGPQWVDIRDSAGNRRLDSLNDFVRLEVESGLQRDGTLVIPILVENADMPAAHDLPDTLKQLAFNNAFRINDDPYFHRDMDSLIKNIQPDKQVRISLRDLIFIFILAALGILFLFYIGVSLLNRSADTGMQQTDIPIIAVASTEMPTIESTPEVRASDTLLPSDEPSAIYTPTNTATSEPAQTDTPTKEPTSTDTTTATNTHTPVPTNTSTSTPSVTATPTVTSVLTATPTETATDTHTPVSTATYTPILTYTPTSSDTPLPTTTSTPTSTETPTISSTVAPTISPEQLALTPVNVNDDWVPYERDFDGITMVLVPAGCFMMGNDEGSDNELPAHPQCLLEPFWIDKFEANNQSGIVNRVTWQEARDICNQRLGRLPTEIEWEYAARGPDGLLYPWGNTFNADATVYIWNWGNSVTGPSSVGTKPEGISWVGVFDLSGNVQEWTLTDFQDYPYSIDGAITQDDALPKIVRGGSYIHDEWQVTSTYREAMPPNLSSFGTGFRCVRDFGSNVDIVVNKATQQPMLNSLPSITPITADNIHLIEIGYIIRSCSSYDFRFVDNHIIVTGNRMYNLETGEYLSQSDEWQDDMPPYEVLRAGNSRLYGGYSGFSNIYDEEGNFVFELIGQQFKFSPDGEYLVGGLYNSCIVYGIQGHDWPVRSGVIRINETVNIRYWPSLNAQLATTFTTGYYPVYAISPDGEWYLLDPRNFWVSRQVVDDIFIPDDLPIVDPDS